LADKAGFSKSSVHRHQHARQRRAQHPESAFWESAAGADFLARVVSATRYPFGLKNPIGAEQLSEFFRLIRLDIHVGVSPMPCVSACGKDHSIDVGTKKALVVLRVRLDTLARREGALQLADCECIGLQVSETVNGEQSQ
jgi:hypothetical protein